MTTANLVEGKGKLMQAKGSECIGCALYGDGKGFVKAEGTGSLGVLILGEAGGRNERQEGLPFRPYAQAGAVLERAIRRAGYVRQQFRVANIVNCQPPNDYLDGADYELAAITHCGVHRDRIIREMRPKVILALGKIAFRTLTGFSGLEADKQSIGLMRGYPIETPYGLVIGSYHPSYLARGQKQLMGILIHDIQMAVKLAQEGFKRNEVEYKIHPSIEDALRFKQKVMDSPKALLTFDIETQRTASESEDDYELAVGEQNEIIQIQFSIAPGTGIALPWIGDFVDVARDILSLGHVKCGHNSWRFDIPKLARHGVEVKGVVHDTMWAFRSLQPDLEGHYNLQSVASFYGMDFPWKHLAGSQFEFYGVADVDSVQRIWPKLEWDLRSRGAWSNCYWKHKVEFEPILGGMSQRGLPIDVGARAEIEKVLQNDMDGALAEVQEKWPKELWNCTPKQGYKREPKDTTGLVRRMFNINDLDGALNTTYQTFQSLNGQIAVERWCKLVPPVPSSQQLKRYMQHFGHPVPRQAKTDKETAEQKGLERLAKKYPKHIYGKVVEYKKKEKIISTYIGGNGWTPDDNGRVHSEFGYHPATGQLSSRCPNIQNIPKHGALAQLFRSMIVAPEGYMLMEADYHSFHAMTLGFESEDTSYMRIASIDIHSFLCSHMVGEGAQLDWPDGQLADYLGYIKDKHKAVRDEKAKRAVLGYGFGMGGFLLQKENPEVYSSQKDAQEVIDWLDRLFPRVARFRKDRVELAHQQTYLISRYGYPRWFWEAKRWDSKKHGWVYGDDAKAAMAFEAANDAHGQMRDVALRLGYCLEMYGLVNMVHDSFVFCCPKHMVEEAAFVIRTEMEKPNPVLKNRVAPDGLVVGVEVSVGKSWDKMEAIR